MTKYLGDQAWSQATGGILRRRDRVALMRQLAGMQLGELARRLGLAKGPAALPLDVADIPVPDSATCRAAEEHVASSLSHALDLHSHRTYYWGMFLAHSEGLRPDPELLYVSALLHDLGLSAREMPKARSCCFAVNGARLADLFLQQQQWDSARRRSVFEAISLHLNLEVPAARHGAEARLLALGAHLDVTGRNLHRLHRRSAGSVLKRFPRDGFAEEIAASVSAGHHPHTRAGILSKLGFKDLALANPLDRPRA
ncbi:MULTISPECIES: HD domain-containing protein [Phaeobacter]|uniref:HD domain protein, cyanamide hydratase family n=1 Tax=Phaeobacter piscinae TaxID=1580596 RepID=A0ABN5DCS9_9RHOB|nr:MULTISPECIES: HD domain-containing protein [Phaeobacter]ATG35097.1 HD domain protein, cyanamide hydratase family [Phaeobacter piscinae]AUQ85617.1 HD domain protein, cyanamide hydratase family [Phaeobacter piscinae]AUR23501.1 HD domain protein, cyanamide hydratase family [Phaeobacter piscinae]